MLLTNLLLACGLSTAVGSGLALKENSNYLHHEKPQEQLHLDNKKYAIDGDFEIGVWYVYDKTGTNSSSYGIQKVNFDVSCNNIIYPCNVLETTYGLTYKYYFNGNTELSSQPFVSYGFNNLGSSELLFRFNESPNFSNDFDLFLKQHLTLSENQNIVGSTTQEIFDVVGDTTTGFIDVLTSAIEDGTELIYNNGNFTFLGVMLLIATGISVVFWIFRLLRGITEGVSR